MAPASWCKMPPPVPQPRPAARRASPCPKRAQYGCGLVFLPPQSHQAPPKLEEQFSHIVQSTGLILLGWRSVPTDNSMLGETARASEPLHSARCSSAGRPSWSTTWPSNGSCTLVRKARLQRDSHLDHRWAEYWYVASLSYKTLVYKGMLLTEQLARYFPDLQNPALESALAMVHSRFSTNTFSQLGPRPPVSL